MMAITYPRDLPSTPGIRSQRFRLEFNTIVHRSPISRLKQSVKRPGHIWRGFYEFGLVTAEQAREMKAWLATMEGETKTFLGHDMANRLPSGIADTGSDTPLVNGVSQTGNTLITDGWRNNGNGLLEPGDYFQIGNTGTAIQLKQCVETLNSNVTGDATISFEPALHNSPADGAVIIFDNPVGVFYLETPDNGADTQVDGFTRFAFSFMELPDV